MKAISKVGVIGAGTMGHGIAQVCAMSALDVVLVDVDEAAMLHGLAAVATSLDRLVRKDRLTTPAKEAALGRIRGTTDYAPLRGCDLVIEAVTESESVKCEVLRKVDAVLAPHALVATNTSSISITRLAATMTAPARFLGMHFFNPPVVMGLVELIRGLQTDDDVVARLEVFTRQIGKTPIVVRSSPGFVVNRLLCPMINEAVFVLQEGLASAQEIDEGMRLGCNHPIGPLALADYVGLDVVLATMEVFMREFNDNKYRPAPLLKEMVAAGFLGRRSGRGFYDYT